LTLLDLWSKGHQRVSCIGNDLVIMLLVVYFVLNQGEKLVRENSLPLLTSRNQSHSQASQSYSRCGRNETHTQSGRREGHRNYQGRSEKRQARSPKRRTHSVDSDLVSVFQDCILHTSTAISHYYLPFSLLL